MTVRKLKLIAPNSLAIVGLKLEDGSLSGFEYSYDDRTKTSLYILPSGMMATVGTSTTLVDSDGKEWGRSDVEFYSLSRSK